jgi:flagellar FliJ protein
MARKRSSQRLQTLLKLAAMKEDAAAKQLAASTERLQQAKLQSEQLEQYEQDYQRRYVEQGTQTVDRNFLLNFQGFFRQLEQARVQQGRAIEHREHEREQARLRWIEQYANRRLLTKVRERRLHAEAAADEKKIQSQIDDRSARAAAKIDREPE